MWIILLFLSGAACTVVELTGSGFESYVTKQIDTLFLVKFFDPACSHCRQLAPVLEELAVQMTEDESFRVGRLDCTSKALPAYGGGVSNKKFCETWGVKGFPSMYFVQGTLRWEYRGERTAEALEAAVHRMRQPAMTELTWAHELDSILKPGQVLYLLAGPAPKHIRTIFEAVARFRQPNTTQFATSESAEVQAAAIGDRLEADGGGAVSAPYVAKLEFGEQPVLLQGQELTSMTKSMELDEWMGANRAPVISLVEPATSIYGELLQGGTPMALMLLDPNQCDVSPCDTHLTTLDGALKQHTAAAALREVARGEAPGGKKFHYGIADGRLWKEWARMHHTTVGEMPRMVVLFGTTGRFVYDMSSTSVDEPSIRAFLTRAAKGELRKEYVGFMMGMPGRGWVIVRRLLPALTFLNFLPHGGLFIPGCIFTIWVYGKLLWPKSRATFITSGELAKETKRA